MATRDRGWSSASGLSRIGRRPARRRCRLVFRPNSGACPEPTRGALRCQYGPRIIFQKSWIDRFRLVAYTLHMLVIRRTDEFIGWLRNLRDVTARAKILERIDRLAL